MPSMGEVLSVQKSGLYYGKLERFPIFMHQNSLSQYHRYKILSDGKTLFWLHASLLLCFVVIITPITIYVTIISLFSHSILSIYPV